jgi:hypothetical protein
MVTVTVTVSRYTQVERCIHKQNHTCAIAQYYAHCIQMKYETSPSYLANTPGDVSCQHTHTRRRFLLTYTHQETFLANIHTHTTSYNMLKAHMYTTRPILLTQMFAPQGMVPSLRVQQCTHMERGKLRVCIYMCVCVSMYICICVYACIPAPMFVYITVILCMHQHV